MSSDKLNQSLATALQDLVDERARIDEAIEKLRGFIGQVGGALSRSRVATKAAKAVKAVKAVSGAKAKRNWSAASRRAAAERMRKYWAQRRKLRVASVGDKKAKAGKQKAAAGTRSKAWNPAKRREAAERMRKYWAERRKTAEA